MNAAGGAGASTICALLAREIAESGGGTTRDVGIIDNEEPTRSPWAAWITPGIDSGLGDRGIADLCKVMPSQHGYPVPAMRRACGAIRGLPGVAVLASTGRYRGDFDVEAASAGFAVSVIDIAFPPLQDNADCLDEMDAEILLTIRGTADGVSAGHATLRAWTECGLPPARIRPVVVGVAGNPSARVMSRLALMGPGTQRAQFIPFDPALARRGLVETLAAGALRSSTRCALRDLSVALGQPAATERTTSAPTLGRLFTVADLNDLLEDSGGARFTTPRTELPIPEGIAR